MKSCSTTASTKCVDSRAVNFRVAKSKELLSLALWLRILKFWFLMKQLQLWMSRVRRLYSRLWIDRWREEPVLLLHIGCQLLGTVKNCLYWTKARLLKKAPMMSSVLIKNLNSINSKWEWKCDKTIVKSLIRIEIKSKICCNFNT